MQNSQQKHYIATVCVEYTCPPIPTRAFDWTAYFDGLEAAIANLIEALEQ